MSFALDLAARFVLLPVLAVQALSVRKHARKLPEPEGARHGRSGAGPLIRVLIVGDSSAAGVGVAHQRDALSGQIEATLGTDHDVAWRLVAKSGDTTGQTIRRLEAEEGDTFDVAVVALGVNDVTHGVPLWRFLTNQRWLAALLRKRFGVRLLVLSSLLLMREFTLLPQPLRWVLARQADRFNTALRAQSDRRVDIEMIATTFEGDGVAMAEDGFHPNGRIYQLWAQEIARAIRARHLV